MNAASFEVFAPPGIPLVQPGDDLGKMIHEALVSAGRAPLDGDVIVVAQKIVSKAEGRIAILSSVEPSAEATRLAASVGKDPRLVELVLRESARVVRTAPGVLIVEHRLGLVMANAGVDQSNVSLGGESVLLLPEDPDASAERIRDRIRMLSGARVGVIVNDSFGRPWRLGTVGVALGAAGLPSLTDRRGNPDLFGRKLEVTVVAVADEIAAAASLVMGQGAEGRPVALVRGLVVEGDPAPAASIRRPPGEDLFR